MSALVVRAHGAGLSPDGLPSDVQGYRAKWALVIGVNYDGVQLPGLTKLNSAENDAQEFARVLRTHYGFTDENTTLLIGKDATKEAIGKAIDKLNSSDVQDDDCVLIYFSGHGYSRPSDGGLATEGFLMPFDIEFDMKSQPLPLPSKMVAMKSLIDELRTQCKARHKLLVLDCCYSGAVFSEGVREASLSDNHGPDQSVRIAKGFQAMTASRELQTAADTGEKSVTSDGRHSPFTGALLKVMLQLPLKRTEGRPITTTEVFGHMKLFLDDRLMRGQTPRCSWLDGGQGEFHFFPEGEFPPIDLPSDRIRKVMLATVPGSFGNWWFEETPWFMPGLRFEILEESPAQRSNEQLEIISPLSLQNAAKTASDRLVRDERKKIQQRGRHLQRLLNVHGDQLQTEILAIIDELATSTKDERKLASETQPASDESDGKSPGKDQETTLDDADAVDVHYLAVLRHAAGGIHRQKAKEDYTRALRLYEDHQESDPMRYKPLWALCLADRGWYAADVERDYIAAVQYYTLAREIYDFGTPPPFRVYVLCQEAAALSKLGRTGAAEDRLKKAEQAIDEVDPSRLSPLSGVYFNRKGWLQMEWFKFKDAVASFDQSLTILAPRTGLAADEEATVDDPQVVEARIICFHNSHGKAMAYRFQGQRNEAAEEYRELLQDGISKTFQQMRASTTGRDANYTMVRSRLIERWVNTQERLGDCSLFGYPTDAAEAADDYRRAWRAIGFLPPSKRARFEEVILSKYALALALPTEVQDLDLARQSLAKLAELRGHTTTSGLDLPQAVASKVFTLLGMTGEAPAAPREKRIEICVRLTQLFIDHCNHKAACAEKEVCEDNPQLRKDLAEFRRYLWKLIDENRADATLSRDDIETALFASRMFLEELVPSAEDPTGAGLTSPRFAQRDGIELLLAYSRLCRKEDSLPFVRPYYDCAIRSMIDLKPKHVKQLIETAAEALAGKNYLKPNVRKPMLVLYGGSSGSYFFLDVPGGVSTYYRLDPNIDSSMLSEAARDPSLRRLPLPAELRKELLALSDRGEINLTWYDSTLGFATPHSVAAADFPPSLKTHKVLTEDTAGTPVVESPKPAREFPFDIPLIVRERLTGDIEKPLPPKDVAGLTTPAPIAP